MQRVWEKERWAGVNCGRRELWVRSVQCGRLLTSPVPPTKKTPTLAAPLRSRIATVVM